MRRHHPTLVLFAAGALAACSGSAPPTAPEPAISAAPVALAPVAADEAGFRRSAAAALSEQRFYTPAGDNAIEHYLALRRLQPGDRNVATALLELLPYALIASEQAIARGDLAEARRLLALIEQVDPQAPSLVRLRDGIVTAESEAARRLVVEAEAAKRAALDAEIAAEAARRARGEAGAAAAATVAPAVPAPATFAPAPIQAAAPASESASAATAAVPTPARGAPVPAPTPRLISAPPPRYPVVAMRRKIEGRVTVQFTIQADGSVGSPSVVSADPPGVFDQAALAAARGWRFEPMGLAVGSVREVRFRLGGSE